MISSLALGLVLAAAGSESASTPEKPKLVVLELQAAGGIEQNVAGALSEAIVKDIESRGFFDVVSSKEVATLVGLERQKQMMGCSDESGCLAELAGAMGARFVLSGTLARLGDAYQLSLQTLDSTKAQPIGRSVRLAESLETLSKQLPYAVAEATATPLPPPPSRILPYALMGSGAVAVLGGSALGLFSLQQEGLVQQELLVSGSLQPIEHYRQRAAEVSRNKTLSVAAIAVGAALIGTGLFFNPAEVVSSSGAASASLVPSLNGMALVGVLP